MNGTTQPRPLLPDAVRSQKFLRTYHHPTGYQFADIAGIFKQSDTRDGKRCLL